MVILVLKEKNYFVGWSLIKYAPKVIMAFIRKQICFMDDRVIEWIQYFRFDFK